MTGTIATRVRSRLTKSLIAILFVLVALLVYGAGVIVFPMSILVNYRNNRCDLALTLGRMYASAYPTFLRDQTLEDPVRECELFTLAAAKDENKAWVEAYDGYQAYLTAYPQGWYVQSAQERSGVALMNIIEAQVEQKKYSEALTHLDLMIEHHSETSVAGQAWTLFPSVYVTWGAELRDTLEYENSEQVFKDFQAWSQTHQRAEDREQAQSELAQTYLAWGRTLRNEKNYMDALAKFDLASSVDPQCGADDSSREVYIEWGNDLLEQDEFAAIEKFELAAYRAGDDDGADANEALVHGYVQWAEHLSAGEDFRGALEQLEMANKVAVITSAKQSVDTAFGKIYLAYSHSNGSQAQRAIMDAVEGLCKWGKQPELPIFGLNEDLIRVGLYGAEAAFPEGMAAQTPGEIHYVACITGERRTIDTDSDLIKLDAGGEYLFISRWKSRIQNFWHLSLRNMSTGEEVATKTFAGEPPPPFPGRWTRWSDDVYEGPLPAMADVSEWIESVIP